MSIMTTHILLVITENRELSPDDVLVLPMDITDISHHQIAFNKVIQHFNRVAYLNYSLKIFVL